MDHQRINAVAAVDQDIRFREQASYPLSLQKHRPKRPAVDSSKQPPSCSSRHFSVTASATIVSLLVSLAAAGGFLFFSFACVTAIYLGALSIAAFVISAVTISAIFAPMVAADISL